MLLIAHRGNFRSPNPERENSPDYIDEAIAAGYDVEIDVWSTESPLEYKLGHDYGQYPIDIDWIYSREDRLWVHCKDAKSLVILAQRLNCDCFGHDRDEFVSTNLGNVWCYPGKIVEGGIAVMPEWNDFEDDLSVCYGVCSDFVERWKS
jgi:hypothetical protein